MSVERWRLSCGCESEVENLGFRLAWVVVNRCDEHPSGPIPVESMALIDLAGCPPPESSQAHE